MKIKLISFEGSWGALKKTESEDLPRQKKNKKNRIWRSLKQKKLEDPSQKRKSEGPKYKRIWRCSHERTNLKTLPKEKESEDAPKKERIWRSPKQEKESEDAPKKERI